MICAIRWEIQEAHIFPAPIAQDTVCLCQPKITQPATIGPSANAIVARIYMLTGKGLETQCRHHHDMCRVARKPVFFVWGGGGGPNM